MQSAQPASKLKTAGKQQLASQTNAPHATRVDFQKLTWGTLRKYQYFFKVKEQTSDVTTRSKEAVIEAVQSHFEEMRVDPTKIVAKFLRIKKDEKNDLNYNLRKPNSRRHGASMLNFGDNGLMN